MANLKEVIEFFDESGELMVVRYPAQGSGEFKAGSQLIVQEAQVAMFSRDGQMLDEFSAGRHTLETRNMSMVGEKLGKGWEKNPFRSLVYFVHTKTFINMGWGTPTPVTFRDSEFRMVQLRAHGSYSIRITKPRLFLTTMVGTKGFEYTHSIQEYLRRLIVARFNESLGKNLKTVLDLAGQYGIVASATRDAVRDEVEQYGLELVDLVIEAITMPPEVQEMVNKATGIEAQNVSKYQAITSADALKDAANNQGSLGGSMGAGLGMGMGMNMAQQMGQSMGQAMNPQGGDGGGNGGGQQSGGASGGFDLKQKLRELKELLDEGLITQEDFDQQKQKLLG